MTPQFDANDQAFAVPPAALRAASEVSLQGPSLIWHQHSSAARHKLDVIRFKVPLQFGPGQVEPGRVRVLNPNVSVTYGTERSVYGILAVIHELVQREQLSAARKLLLAIAPEQVDQSVRRFMTAIQKPIVQSRRPARQGLSTEMAWLKQHASEFRGKWVALLGADLIDADDQLQDLMERLSLKNLPRRPFIHLC